ncbi:toll-like receptor 4 [Biomphalaria glabrata]|uniref:Toll-like receptor 4 n=1 Tax=Biomphalaria glabrata TaxID=6526 RepID=A0A9W2Z1T4_BIOGL|nr:toll-like receptor 4 [Biomphalaria glabrata]
MFPPKLKYLYMGGGHLKGSIRNLFFSPNNSLIGIKLVNNYFPSLIGPVYGLDNLVYLSLKYCSIMNINETFFNQFTSLTKLMLGYNKLEPYFRLMESNIRPFSKLNKLQTLDLSGNAITKMHADIFAGLTNLRILYFEMNSMWIFHLNIGHMMNLQYVHMRNSQISSFSLEVRQHIDVLCSNKSRVVAKPNSLRLRQLRFHSMDVELAGIRPNAEVIAFTSLFRWKLRYIYYATYLKLKHSEQEHDGQLRYDVFISFAHQDEEFILKDVYPELRSRGLNVHVHGRDFVAASMAETLWPVSSSPELSSRGLNVHVHGRDFVAGEFMASNIVTAVRESRKTLVVLTLDLLKSKWCNYEIQMANMESVHTGRQVLVFLLKDSLNNKQLGTELLFHIRNNTYVVYPQNGTKGSRNELSVFWDKLYKDLRT